MQDAGVNLCVGTDSLASTDSLSLLAELRRLSQTAPESTAEQLLRTVTVHPARALRREGQLGKIVPGSIPDLIAVPATGSLGDVHEEIVQYTGAIPWVMIDGEVRRA